jgi:hypothetical protein
MGKVYSASQFPTLTLQEIIARVWVYEAAIGTTPGRFVVPPGTSLDVDLQNVPLAPSGTDAHVILPSGLTLNITSGSIDLQDNTLEIDGPFIAGSNSNVFSWTPWTPDPYTTFCLNRPTGRVIWGPPIPTIRCSTKMVSRITNTAR